MGNLKELYEKEIHPKIKEELGIKNDMQVPRITKISLNMGVGEALGDRKLLDSAIADLETISGQKAVINNARKSIAAFKVRAGYPIGCKVTLRRSRMYEFLDRLITVAVPRIKDFRGLSLKSFDGRGNYNFGINEQIIFPEINTAKLGHTLGMNITIVTANGTDEQSDKLLTAMGMPFARPEEN